MIKFWLLCVTNVNCKLLLFIYFWENMERSVAYFSIILLPERFSSIKVFLLYFFPLCTRLNITCFGWRYVHETKESTHMTSMNLQPAVLSLLLSLFRILCRWWSTVTASVNSIIRKLCYFVSQFSSLARLGSLAYTRKAFFFLHADIDYRIRSVIVKNTRRVR